jgi:hypothetical protein
VTQDTAHKTVLLRKAADTYHQLVSFDEEAQCLISLSNLLESDERIDCLVSAWRIYILAIAVFQYDTSFEWKGESENLCGSYSETIRDYFEKAVATLRTALRQRDVDRCKLREKLVDECVKRQNEGEWGSDHCRMSIEKAFT